MANLPTIEDAELAILRHISSLNIRGGEIFNAMIMKIELQKKGFSSTEIDPAMDNLFQKGFFEAGTGPFMKLTDAGYKAL